MTTALRCTCLEDVEEKLRDHYQTQLGTDVEVRTADTVFILGNGGGTALRQTFCIKADKPGYRSRKGKEVSMMASFCPFCGKSTGDQS
ncbi:hypothetical protein [Cupriavidus pauculus]|uniref:hypothetical protein n=1 Tax=Cupriavidus pauculus TaxID=82633 RepID=UPI001D0BFB2B|nr:hypothetical protein [Cupriavidus pauculus]